MICVRLMTKMEERKWRDYSRVLTSDHSRVSLLLMGGLRVLQWKRQYFMVEDGTFYRVKADGAKIALFSLLICTVKLAPHMKVILVCGTSVVCCVLRTRRLVADKPLSGAILL